MNQKEKVALIGETAAPEKISQEKFDDLVKDCLSKEFTWKPAVAYCFCRHCGTHGEASVGYLKDLLKVAEELQQPLAISGEPQELASYYFVTDVCLICCNKERIGKIEICKIEA